MFKLISMVDFILEIDWLTTAEFCKKYNISPPYFTGEIASSVEQILRIDAIKHRIFIEYAKLLNTQLTVELLTKMNFKELPKRSSSFPSRYEYGKYKIIDDEHGFWMAGYDSVDGKRLHKLSDLTGYNLTINWGIPGITPCSNYNIGDYAKVRQ